MRKGSIGWNGFSESFGPVFSRTLPLGSAVLPVQSDYYTLVLSGAAPQLVFAAPPAPQVVTSPEPSTLALAATGLLALGITARRRHGSHG